MNNKVFLLSKVFLTTILFLFFTRNILSQTTYYVSSSDGNDSNAGKSSSSPWKNLSKLNSTRFYPGDKILFKKGDSWTGQWAVNNSGSSSNPIYIGGYGSGSNPVIGGNNSLQYLFSLSTNVSYITIDGIYFKDCDPNGYKGMIFGNSSNHNILIQNCFFNQSEASKNSSYAMICMRDANNVTITNCDLTGKSQGIHFRANNNNDHSRCSSYND